MPAEKRDKELPLSLKMEIEIGRKWFIVLIVSGIVAFSGILFAYIKTTHADAEIQKVLDTLHEAEKYVLIATPDGRIARVAKTPISSMLLEKYVDFVVRNYLVIDKSDLTKGFTAYIKSLDDLYNNSDKVKVLASMIEPKDSPNREKSLKKILGFLKYLMASANNDRLPEYITVLDIEKKQFLPDKNKFRYIVTYNVQVKVLDKSGVLNTYLSKISFDILGEFNPIKASELNPYGLFIIDIKKFVYPEK